MNSFPRYSRSVAMLLALLGALALGGCQTSPSPPQPPPPEVEPVPEPDQTATAAATTDQAAEQADDQAQATAAPAPAGQTATQAPAAAGTTAEERAEALDRKLEATYDEHDAMLREHQANARAEATAIAAQRPPDAQGTEDEDAEQGELYEGLPGFGTPPPKGDEDTGDGATAAGTGTDQGTGAATASAAGTPTSGGKVGGATVPEDIPDARDDDIVARQLREAAQMEKDPQLREKLWDEYRKYKNQQAAQ